MAVSATTSIRVPKELLGKARKAVASGYYTSVNELIVAGLRHEIYEVRESEAVRLVREARDEMWQEALDKAGGDEEKASRVFFDKLKKEEENDPLIKKAKAKDLYLSRS